jgi:hypothetical protein
MDGQRDVVVIGVDPHKRSVTIEARDAREVLRATGSFSTTTAGYLAMLRYCWQWPRRVWAVEGAGGVGRPLAQRLLAEGERALDVPAKLSARVRVLGAGHGRKTDATDAHAVVMAALRNRNQLRELSLAEEGLLRRSSPGGDGRVWLRSWAGASTSSRPSERRRVGVCWVPVPAGGDHGRGPLVPALRPVLPRRRGAAGRARC